MFAIYGHCASGYTELWDVKPTLEDAKATGVKVLADHPVTPCGTGGVRWVEVIGTDDDTMIGLSREDAGHWQSA